MRELKTICGFKALLIGLSALLPLATLAVAQEVDSQVGKPISGIDRTYKATVRDEVTGQPTARTSDHPPAVEADSKWGLSGSDTVSGRPPIERTTSATPSVRVQQTAQTPVSQMEPMFTAKPAPDLKSSSSTFGVAQGTAKPVTRVSNAPVGSRAPQHNIAAVRSRRNAGSARDKSSLLKSARVRSPSSTHRRKHRTLSASRNSIGHAKGILLQ
jgi:hypothetical protein